MKVQAVCAGKVIIIKYKFSNLMSFIHYAQRCGKGCERIQLSGVHGLCKRLINISIGLDKVTFLLNHTDVAQLSKLFFYV